MRTALFRTTSFQLALLSMAVTGISLSILMGVIYWFSIGFLERQTTETIESEINSLAEHYRNDKLQGLSRVIDQRIKADEAGRKIYLFTDSNLRPLAGNLRQWPDPHPTDDGWLEFERGGATVRARFYPLAPGLNLLVGRDVRELKQFTDSFRRAMFIGIAVTLALSLLSGVVMGSGLLRRVDAISRAARRIMEGDLSQRMPNRGSGDELDQLADHLNTMLDRIDVLMHSSRLVADNIAHDLRTPLTRLRNKLESFRSRDDISVRDGLDGCIEDADALLVTFQAMLRIARLQSGGYSGTLGSVDAAQLVHDAAELYHAVADDAGIALSAQVMEDCHVEADRDLLFQAVTNLLDNAIKYTPRHGRVYITSTRESDQRVAITVADSGPGIPAHLRERALEPFFRLDQSRTKPGNGLGLSLVKAIADYHHAELSLGDAAPGLIVTLRLPIAKSDALPAPPPLPALPAAVSSR